MAGKNIVQKISARAASKAAVETGDFVHVRSNCSTPIGGDGDARGVKQLDRAAKPTVFDPKKVAVIVGHAATRSL